jgi:hypothetical protein
VLEPAWGEIIASIRLPDDWKQRIELMSGDADQREAILKEREVIQERMRRLRRLYQDLLIEDDEYKVEYERLQTKLAGLVLPNSPHLFQAAEYLENLGMLWEAAALEEQQAITRILLKAMYVDVNEERIVAIEPLPVFRVLFAEFCEGIGVEIL